MARATKAKKSADGDGDCCGTGCCGEGSGCCGLPQPGCCEIEAVVAVDARGQMVLPKEVREKFGVAAGDKLALAIWKRDDEPCCITLVKADELADRLRATYGPLLKEVVG